MCEEERPAKRFKSEDEKLSKFLEWLKEFGFYVNKKVEIVQGGSRDRYGMIATGDIDAEEKVFSIPKEMLLCPETCGISAILEKEKEKLSSESGWIPLLLALMYEHCNPQSKWRPYLDLVDLSHLDPPIFWEREELEVDLQGCGITELVGRDLSNMKAEFEEIALPFIKRHKDKFGDKCQDFELYKKMVAFVMAYSFVEERSATGQDSDNDDSESEEDTERVTVMVPLADILNHVARNNASLRFGETQFDMTATRKIEKGNEVFNTYGELSNVDSLLKHGFVEPYPENTNEEVEIPHSLFYTICNNKAENKEVWKRKWDYLKTEGIVSNEDSFAFSETEVVDEFPLHTALKVYFMSEKEFKDAKKTGSLLDGDYHSFGEDFFVNIAKPWRDLLKTMIESRLAEYPHSKDDDEATLSSKSDNLSSRAKWSLLLRISHRRLFARILENLSHDSDER